MKGLDRDQPGPRCTAENRTQARALVIAPSLEERDLCHWYAPPRLPLGRTNTSSQQHFAIKLSTSHSNKNQDSNRILPRIVLKKTPNKQAGRRGGAAEQLLHTPHAHFEQGPNPTFPTRGGRHATQVSQNQPDTALIKARTPWSPCLGPCHHHPPTQGIPAKGLGCPEDTRTALRRRCHKALLHSELARLLVFISKNSWKESLACFPLTPSHPPAAHSPSRDDSPLPCWRRGMAAKPETGVVHARVRCTAMPPATRHGTQAPNSSPAAASWPAR